MLNTNFINRKYISEVFVYNDKSYLDKGQCIVSELDISFLFVYFDELWDKLLAERKRYAGKVVAREVTTFMLETLPMFYSYLANIIRCALTYNSDESLFSFIDKNSMFKVNVGDYMSKTENVYTEKKHKETGVLAKRFVQRLKNEYVFDDFSCLDFSGYSFTFTELRYSQFHHTCLSNTTFHGSALIGTNFYKAQMENCNLDNCSIYEANFSHAKLKKASFIGVRGRAGLPDGTRWHFVGFLPVLFRHADLTDTNFIGANISGADFTSANLVGADFTGAVLDGAIFDNNT